MKILITPATVKMAKDILLSGKNFKPFNELFETSEQVTAKHKLFEQFVTVTGCQIPKIFIYIVMDDIFGNCTEKDEDGNLGYRLKLNK